MVLKARAACFGNEKGMLWLYCWPMTAEIDRTILVSNQAAKSQVTIIVRRDRMLIRTGHY